MTKKKITNNGISLREFARRRNVSHTAVQTWVADGLPTMADGKIDPKAAVAWEKKYRRLEVDATKHGDVSLSESLRRKEFALAGIRELELAAKSGELVTIKDAVAMLEGAISVARSRLLAIPTAAAWELAQESDPAKVEKILKGLVFDALNELARGASLDGGGNA